MTAAEIRAEHAIVVDAPASAVYAVVTDVALWPVVFGPTVYTRVLDRRPDGDRFDIWAMMPDGAVNAWRSRREFDPPDLRVTFAQEHDDTVFGLMGGGWSCVPLDDRRTRVVLEHRYNPPPDPVDARRIASVLDHNGSAELEALRTAAVLPGGLGGWLLTFTESVELAGPAGAARDFVWDAGRWPKRLPHVAGLDLTERAAGVQDMTMRTRTPDGSEHTTRSVRVPLADGSIVYKQIQPPRALLGHAGRWEFRTGPAGPVIRSTHTVLVDPVGAAEVFGPSVRADEAVGRVRAALSANSRVTMEYASRYAASIGATR